MSTDRGALLSLVLDQSRVGVAVLDAAARYRYVNERLGQINARAPEEHLGRDVHEVLVAELAEQVDRLVRHVARTGEPMLAEQAEGATPGGGRAAFEVSYLPLQSGDERLVAAIVVDVTARTQAVEEARRRQRQQAALADLGQLALADPVLDDVLTAATAMLTRELGAERAGVLVFAPSRDHLVMRAGTGFPDAAIGTMQAKAGPRSQAGYTLQEGDAVISRDAVDETRFAFTDALLELGVRSAVSVPIPGAGGPYGVLGVLASRPDHFDEDDANLVRAAANVLGAAAVRAAQAAELAELAAQRGRLVAQALDAGDRERRQVADVLHDDVLQHLLFARMELEQMEADAAPKARMMESIEAATKLLRGVVGGLHPVSLGHAGLSGAFESLAAECRARSRVELHVDVAPAAEGAQDRLLYSIARELVTNVIKHAGASRARLGLAREPAVLVLVVADDGCGLDPDAFETALARGHIGLANIRERVVAVGGHVEVAGGIDGRGATVRVRVPAHAGV